MIIVEGEQLARGSVREQGRIQCVKPKPARFGSGRVERGGRETTREGKREFKSETEVHFCSWFFEEEDGEVDAGMIRRGGGHTINIYIYIMLC